MNDFATHIVVPAEHPSLAGHFPGRPVVPGVVLLEQVLDALRTALGRRIELRTIVSTKFLQAVMPGQSLQVSISVRTEPSGALKARFTASHAQALAFEGSFLLASLAETADG